MKIDFKFLRFEPKSIEEIGTVEFSKNEIIDLYRKMVMIRIFEEELLKHYENLEIRGELHLAIGQEAVAVGIISELKDTDYLVSNHRSHGHILSKGVDPKLIAAEIYGKETGLCKGKGGHMHLTDINKKVLTTGIVGGGIPIGAGLAFASKYLGNDSITVVFLGDGAVNQGVFHETLNLASLWSLPIIFVVEDNRYGFSLIKEKSTSVEYNAQRGIAYNMKNYEILDGNDVLQVKAIAKKIISEVRNEKKPILLEVRTYRLRPHVELVDSEIYRSNEEKKTWAINDPILRLENKILSEKIATDEELKTIREEIKKDVENAINFAIESPFPATESAYTDIYVEEKVLEEYSAREGKRQLGMYEAINEAIRDEMSRDERIILLGEDVGVLGGAFWCTQDLLRKFGSNRVLDTPISESAFIGLGIGAAIAGLRPIVELQMVDFSLVAMDQILNHLAKLRYMSGGQLKIPIVIRAPIGGGYGDAAQHSQVLYSMFAHVPGLYVVAPSNPFDAKGLLISSIRSDNPVIFLEHKLLYGVPFLPPGAFSHVPEESYTIPLGKAKVIREGTDITIIGIAYTVHLALEAANELANEGISAEVIDLRSLVPLDIKTILESVKKTRRVLIVDEDYLSYGLSGEIAAIIAENPELYDKLKAPIMRIANPNVPIPFSEPLEKEILPDVNKIIKKVKMMLKP
jgi:2-oxoisovalerate dehydrogenase E1 component